MIPTGTILARSKAIRARTMLIEDYGHHFRHSQSDVRPSRWKTNLNATLRLQVHPQTLLFRFLPSKFTRAYPCLYDLRAISRTSSFWSRALPLTTISSNFLNEFTFLDALYINYSFKSLWLVFNLSLVCERPRIATIAFWMIVTLRFLHFLGLYFDTFVITNLVGIFVHKE